jgi:predicted AlkP superfamily pyrophosphatase or phosphodiesterase
MHRTMSSLRLALALLLLALAGCVGPRAEREKAAAQPPLILISVDGLRADYLDRGVTPNIAALAARGVRATAMRPSFPSLTFPNHYTLVTGKRPDRNGIVNNTMQDPAIPGVTFALSNRTAVEDRRWWDEAEPVWVTAEKAGVRTATMFWPGSEAAIGGVRPSAWLSFDGEMPNEKRVAQLLAWVDAPVRPGFMTLYFDTVDHAGHEFGPDAPETTAALAEVDARIGDLVAGLAARGVAANIVLVSDHGMATVSSDRSIILKDLLPPDSFRLVTGGAVAGLEALPGKDAVLASALDNAHPHMRCWRKDAIPAALHYGRNARVPAFVCLADPGWMVWGMPARPGTRLGGMHGYDPAAAEMAASFVAAGPNFREGMTIEPFDNVDVYPLLMTLIGVDPRPSDGNPATLRSALRASPRN